METFFETRCRKNTLRSVIIPVRRCKKTFVQLWSLVTSAALFVTVADRQWKTARCHHSPAHLTCCWGGYHTSAVTSVYWCVSNLSELMACCCIRPSTMMAEETSCLCHLGEDTSSSGNQWLYTFFSLNFLKFISLVYVQLNLARLDSIRFDFIALNLMWFDLA